MSFPRNDRLRAVDTAINTALLSFGLGFALTALVVLLVRASAAGDVWAIVTVSIYGSTLILLYVFSLLSHLLRTTRASYLLDIFDRSAIYLLIAGSYTPFTLTVLRGGWGWSIFEVIWGLAVLGIVFGAISQRWRSSFANALYLLMGWAIIVATVPLVRVLSAFTIGFLVAGGIFYSAGMLFFLTKSTFKETLWHIFVLGGSICHLVAVLSIIHS